MKLTFLNLLALLLIGLKLTGLIAWSWLIVLLPLYGPFVLELLMTLIFAGIGAGAIALITVVAVVLNVLGRLIGRAFGR